MSKNKKLIKLKKKKNKNSTGRLYTLLNGAIITLIMFIFLTTASRSLQLSVAAFAVRRGVWVLSLACPFHDARARLHIHAHIQTNCFKLTHTYTHTYVYIHALIHKLLRPQRSLLEQSNKCAKARASDASGAYEYMRVR